MVDVLESASKTMAGEPIVEPDVLDPERQLGAADALPVVHHLHLGHGEQPEIDGDPDAEVKDGRLRHSQMRW
jgi:hypothetical protein